ncbi:hypothetical protein PHPALM_3846, partial [Phytophthora palmivora]
MPDWIDPKEFKRLWSSLVKDGWRARGPSGLSSDHTYVKPGVKGKLQKDKVNVEYFVEQAADVSGPAASRQQVVIDVVENFEEERKTEDEPAFDAFDRDDFMEAFRAENLFGPVDVDDVNLSDEPFLCSAESEDEGSAFDEQEGGEEDYVDDVESDPDFEDVSEVFRQDDAECVSLLVPGGNSELKLDGAALYNGRWGTTKSAAAFAESPIGMFFYFLPKSLWKKIALESDAYRQRSIPVIAQQT